MPDRHRYFKCATARDVRYFRVEADEDGAGRGPVMRLQDGEWRPTVYPSSSQFHRAQLTEPREVTEDEIPDELFAGREAQ